MINVKNYTHFLISYCFVNIGVYPYKLYSSLEISEISALRSQIKTVKDGGGQINSIILIKKK